MSLWRCANCRREFEAAKPSCADCGLDPEKDRRDADLFLPILVHHFDPPSKVAGRGLGYAACDARIRVGTPRCMFTSDPGSVNCAGCKASEVFLKAGGKDNGVLDMPLNPKRGG